GIPLAPRGVPQSEVSFDIDAYAIVQVAAKDLGTDQEQSMTITGGSALEQEGIDQMLTDAEQHAAVDKQRGEEAETRNQAESLVQQTKKFLKNNDEKVSEETKNKVQSAIDEANEALKGEDSAKISEAIENLTQASQELGSAMYADAQAGAAAAGGDGSDSAEAGSGSASAEGDDVMDAEVVDEDDSSKSGKG